MDDEVSLVEAVQQRFCTKNVPQLYTEYFFDYISGFQTCTAVKKPQTR